jgi:hypothetical protein
MGSIASGIFDDLFTPLPEAPVSSSKDPLDYVAEYVGSATGTWDFLSFIDQSLCNLKVLPSFSENEPALFGRISDVIYTLGIWLSIPALISDSNALRRSFAHVLEVRDLPESDPLKIRKITRAAKACFLDSMTVANSFSQASLFLDRVKIFAYNAVQLRIIDGIYYVTSAIGDGAELIEECFKLNEYQSSQNDVPNPVEDAKLKEKKCLSWMKIVKDVASVALSLIAIIGILFVSTQAIPLIAVMCLVLNTFWLTMKIACHFYNKIVVEEQPTGQIRLATI